MNHSIKFLIVFFLIAISLQAQNSQDAIKNLEDTTSAIVTLNENLNIAEFIRFPNDNPLTLRGSTVQEKVFSFLETYKTVFDLKEPNESFNLESIKTDNYGFQHIILNQVYNGVPIYDGKLKFHFNAENKLTSINGNFLPNIKLIETPSLTDIDANAIAVESIINQDLNKSGEPLFINKNKLYIFQKGLAQGHYTTRHLVYEVEVRNDLDVREFVFVDAHSGAVIEQFTGMAHALDRIVYENNTSTIVWEEGDPFPGTLTIWQRNEVETSAHTYNFFNNAFGYESYDGADARMRTVNNTTGGCPNASWNGSTANYCDGTASDDVIGHEWGHAYTGSTSGLIYAWQSGAMNESYSDIWGETIDLINNYEDADDDVSLRTACNSSDRWMIGEDASAFGGAIRDMWNPPCNGDPGKVTDGNYRCGSGDSGGVHSNSGIPNHAYALLVDGGTYNEQTISGIGFTKAAHIFWRAQETYLTSTSDFAVYADALETACTDLIGINLEGLSTTSTPAGPSGEIISIADYNQLVSSLLAVELRINPDACDFQTILAPTPDLCAAASTNPTFMENWESGFGSWTETELPTNPSDWDSRPWIIESSVPDSWPSQAIFAENNPLNGNCRGDLDNGIIRLESPLITLPDYDEGTFELAFDHYVALEPNWDGANMKYSINGTDWDLLPGSAFLFNPYNGVINGGENDNPMANEPAFTGSDGGSTGGSWGKSVIDLSALGLGANDTVAFRWEVGSDGCNGRIGWYLDNIVIYNCSRPLSVDEFETLKNGISVFPNPSNGVFTLKKTLNIDLNKAEIHDINGRFIKQVDLSNMSQELNINIANLSSGIYFMTVSSPLAKTVIKLIKE